MTKSSLTFGAMSLLAIAAIALTFGFARAQETPAKTGTESKPAADPLEEKERLRELAELKADIERTSLAEDFGPRQDEPKWRLYEHLSPMPRGKDGKREIVHPQAIVKDAKLHLLTGEGKQSTSIGFPRRVTGNYRTINASFSLAINDKARGASFSLLNTQRFGTKGPAFQLYRQKGLEGVKVEAPEWDEPNLWDSFAVGFDVHNPKNEDYFDEWGNVHDQPEHEVSLHFARKELFNKRSTYNFRDGQEIKVSIQVRFVTGGAEVDVTIDDDRVFVEQFIPHMLAYESRVAFGAFAEEAGALATIDDLNVRWQDPAEADPAPITVQTFRSKLLSRGKGNSADDEFELLPSIIEAERILMTYRLKPPMIRDEWDRKAAVYAWSSTGERFEIARILTPFMMWDAEYDFVVDVTRFAYLLYGKTRLGVMAGANVGDGYCVDLDFTYYRRPEDVTPMPKTISAETLWSTSIHFNNKKGERNEPEAITLTAPKGSKRAYVRITVTGHGVREFKPADRTLMVNEAKFENTLWTTDCYLNPYRPQFGTWKFNRAGWGPGSVARVWEIDITEELLSGRTLKLHYIPDDVQEDKWAEHWLEAAIFFVG